MEWGVASADSAELAIVHELSIRLRRSSLSLSWACKYSAETKNWGVSLFRRESCILGDLLSDLGSFSSFSSESLRFSELLSVSRLALSVPFVLSLLCLVNWQSSWYHLTAVSFSVNRSSYYAISRENGEEKNLSMGDELDGAILVVIDQGERDIDNI